MPLTYTGRRVRPESRDYPSLLDIAVSLSRQPRFAGHCRRWWSVLDHTLFGDELLLADFVPRDRRRMWLLHDAHEAITGDVPTDFKTADLRALQDRLDARIYPAFGFVAEHHLPELIKRLDSRCLRAEAAVVGPPDGAGVFPRPETKDKARLYELLVEWPRAVGFPPFELAQETHPAVKTYLQRMTDVL